MIDRPASNCYGRRMRQLPFLVLACLLPGVLRGQDPEAPPKPTFSPDKKWEYRVVEDAAALVRAGENTAAINLCDPEEGLKTESGTLVWAADSRRFAFNYRAGGKYYSFDLYELAGTTWKKLPDVIDNDGPVTRLIARSEKEQLKELGAKKDANPNSVMERWRVRRWLNNDVFEAYVNSESRVMISKNAEDPEYFGARVLFTGKCDNRGSWKIVTCRLLSDAEGEKINMEE